MPKFIYDKNKFYEQGEIKMEIKKFAVGFVIALSVAFALDIVSKTTSHDKDPESAIGHEILLLTEPDDSRVR